MIYLLLLLTSQDLIKQVIIGLFEAIKNIGQTLANNLIKLFDQ
jgi:hypothetical protein